MSGTSTSKFTASGTVPNQGALGDYHRFNFEDTNPHVRLQAYSQYAPTSNNTSTINIETRNYNYSGFRWHHTTQSTDINSFGSFAFQSFVGDGEGVNVIGFNGSQINMYFPVYLSGLLDLGNNKINNLATPAVSTDAATKGYVDSTLGASTITLTGDVTGSGVLGTPFAATIASRLNQIPTPTGAVSMNSQKITSLANGTVSADGVNLGQLNSAISAGTITLTGNVTGSGTVGTPFATTIATTLNNIPIATGAININSKNMNSVGNVGIGVASPAVPIHFANVVADCKIGLYRAANDFQVYGFGVLGNTLKYSVDGPASSHVFYCGASSTTSTELFRVAGAGYATVSGGDGTFYSRVPSATWFKTSNALATGVSANTWTKANSSTGLSVTPVQFTVAANKLTFTGSDLGTDCTGMFSASVVLTHISGTPKLGLAVYLNGLAQQGCVSYVNPTAVGNLYNLSITPTLVTLSPGDYLEIFVLASNANTITVTEMCLSFSAC